MPRVGENFDHNIKLVDAVERIAKKKDITNSQLALAWLLAQGNGMEFHKKYILTNLAES